MSTRKDIIDRCTNSITTRYDRPDISALKPSVWEDLEVKFIAQSEGAACRVISASSENETDEIIRTVYPDAKVIASALPFVKSATKNPDTIKSADELNHTDVGVIRAEFGVAENGAVWIPQQTKERAVCFISENLVVLLKRSNIVNNMHEAYRLIQQKEYGVDEFNSFGYGVFMAGPSKTADIAQVLVEGAQAARSLTLVLTD